MHKPDRLRPSFQGSPGMSTILHQPIASAPYEPYGGPPGRLDVADVVTTANSSSIAAGLCIAQGGPLVYRVDYDAVVVALDDELVWEDAGGPQALKTGDIVWIAEGARNSYWSTGTSRFFYTTWPVDWAGIVGWQAGRDVKDLANQGGPEGSLEGIAVYRRADARFTALASRGGQADLAQVLGPRQEVSMAAGLIGLDGAALDLALSWDMALVVLDGTVRLEAPDRHIDPQHGDLLWLPRGAEVSLASEGQAVLAYVASPVDWADRIA